MIKTENSLSNLYFGDLEAFDEANNNKDFFEQTFVAPQSMSISQLRNNRRFVIIGRKGVGKTAVQMHFANKMAEEGYQSTFFRFSEDLRADDYVQISQTQSRISLVSLANSKDIFFHYDFRDVWERVFFNKIASRLKSEGIENKFTSFILPNNNRLRNIFEGISRSLSVKISGDMGVVAAEAGFDLSKLAEKEEISLKDFNQISRELFLTHCKNVKLYFFVDELVFSRLDAKGDEVKIRAAMVRDIVKTCRELNNMCAQSNLEIHFICSLRPEIRNLINEYDSEIGKILDGKDVLLTWYIEGRNNRVLIEDVFRLKVKHSSDNPIDVSKFVIGNVSFGKKVISFSEYLKTNTWGRPRDVVRLLLAIQKMSPNSTYITEDELKACLNEYSRASAKELIDELGVVHGQQILTALKQGIRRKTYNDADELLRDLPYTPSDAATFITELFEIGVIGGFDSEVGNYHWHHRGDTYLKPHHQIRIHPALWNEFGIRPG